MMSKIKKQKPPGYVFGRPAKYGQEILEKSRQYIDLCKDKQTKKGLTVNLPTKAGLALYLGVNNDTLYQWSKEYKDFSDVMAILTHMQESALINNGLNGNYNPTIAKLILASKHNYVEKTEVDQNVKGLNLSDLFKRAK